MKVGNVMPMWKPVSACAVALLVLAGCSAAPSEVPEEQVDEVAPPVTKEPEAAEGPLTISPVEEPVSSLSPDEQFLEAVGPATDELGLSHATDAQLLDAGYRACDQMRAGATTLEVQVVEGEEMVGGVLYEASRAIAHFSLEYLCTDVDTL